MQKGKANMSLTGEQITAENLERLRARVDAGNTSIPSYYSDDEDERKLAMWRLWLCRVRKSGELNEYRSHAIEQCEMILPGFITNAKQHSSYKTAIDNIDELDAFMKNNGRAPRQSRNGPHGVEHYLAIKVSTMRRDYADKKLSPEAIEYVLHHDNKELAELILTKPRHYSSGRKRLNELKAFVKKHNRRPHPHSNDRAERELGIWTRNQVAMGEAKRPETQEIRNEVKKIYEKLGSKDDEVRIEIQSA